MANLKNVIYLSNEDYETLASTGTVTIDGETLTYDENNVYITPDKLASTTEDGLMSAADKSKLNNIESNAQVNVQADWNQTDTTADDYIKNKLQVDADFSLTSANPVQNKVISERLKDISNTLTHIKYKLFGVTTLSEIDYKVDYATIYPIPETLSDEDGTHRVVYSDTQLKDIDGNSVAWNQLFDYANVRGNVSTVSVSGSKITATFSSAPSTNSGFYTDTVKSISEHYYLVRGYITLTEAGTVRLGIVGKNQDFSANTRTYFSFIQQATGDYAFSFYLQGTPNWTGGGTMVAEDIVITDLTQLGKSYSNPLAFNRDYPLPHYEFDTGSIKNTVIKGIKVNGYNLFDGEWDLTANDKILTFTNYVRVIAGKEYTAEGNINYQAMYFDCYDADYNLLENPELTIISPTSRKGIIPNNACFVKVRLYNSAGIAIENFAFHLTGTRTGYTPYKEPHTINIPQTKLPSAGSVHDTIKFVEGNIIDGEQRYNMVYVSRIGSDDLGTLDWTYLTNEAGHERFNSTSLSTLIKVIDANTLGNLLCSKYKRATDGDTYAHREDKIIGTHNGIVQVYDSSYTDPSIFKQAVSGIILNYEKNEYTETVLATGLTFEEVSAIIEQCGSIEALFDNVPPNLKTTFVVNKVIVS